MLRYKINRKLEDKQFLSENTDKYSRNIFISNIEQDDDGNFVLTSVNHLLLNGDTIRIVRSYGTLYLYEEREVTVIDKDTFSIGKFPDLHLIAYNVESTSSIKYVTSAQTEEMIKYVEIDLSNQHYFVTDKHISTYYTMGTLTDEQYKTTTIKKCDGEFVLSNDKFLFQANGVTDDNWFITENFTFLNTQNCSIYYYNEDDEKVYIDCFVPLNGSTDDVTNVLYWEYKTAKNLNYFNENSNKFDYYCVDNRFFTIDDTITLANGCTIWSKDRFLSVQIPIGETFATDTLKEESFSDGYVERVENENINEIIDYEKMQFSPCYTNGGYGDDELLDVSAITFNLHFREREDSGTSKWTTSIDSDWANYTVTDKNTLTIKDDYSSFDITDGDLLGTMGFDDDDVYSQANCLKKSFIRLCFYDSRNKANQVLQFYATIFLDTNDLFDKYISIKNFGAADDGEAYVDCAFNEDTKKDYRKYRLSCNFSCTNKYDMDNCSEGFYLYLFPSLIDKANVTPLYMRVEFYHAKYGYKIPMLNPMPTVGDGKLTNFPTYYMTADGSIRTDRYVMDDLYTKVYIKYDYTKRRYVWIIPNQTSDEIVFNLFEPRINSPESDYE